MDMVLAKTEDSTADLEREPIDAFYETETGTIRANNTTLGGDDGVGLAAMLAVIHDPSIIHGPIEHLFTVNEEDLPGKCIMEDMKLGDINAKYYLNIDGENFNELTYGGAGCSTMKYNCPIPQVDTKGKQCFRVSLTGLLGGHSGVNITRPHINPIVFIAQCAIDFASLNNVEFAISKFDGGPINNSLPTYCKLDVIMEQRLFDKFKRFLTNQILISKKVCQGYEDAAVLTFDRVPTPKKAYAFDVAKKIFLFASLAPNKVFTASKKSNNMFSSSNLGFVSIDNGMLRIDFKIRSFLDGEVQRKVRKIKSLGDLLGFTEFEQTGQLYAFINDIAHNHAADIYSQAYEDIMGRPIQKLTVAGGLECAVVCLKNPSMTHNTICIATTLSNCHSPYESFSVQDTVKF
ncbi:MAG: hypothetical protein MJ219_02395 [Mycoplasmoidaceae bacterium]|nr:hypothetical protein [Mycoplasmoidaceae bacterium]